MTDSQGKDYILDSSDEDTDQTVHDAGEESYRREIEDIVKGFILEKDLMSQGHEDEMIRMKTNFQREKVDLLRHIEEERESLRQNSRMTSLTSNETGYVSGSHGDSEASNLNFYSGELPSSKGQATSLSYGDLDNNLIKEIAEVCLRMNNGVISSKIRPDLDIEDKYERDKEIFERRFITEKRELKRQLEDDYNRKLEQEKNRYEGQIQELKATITDLQWKKRELESRNRNDKEKNEIVFERERNEMEKRHLQTVHDMKRKLEEKYSTDIIKQKNSYEENISELQEDISRLTLQLRELNDSLRQEKEIIVEKFEREVKEMEKAFSDQRNSLKTTLESEFVLRLEKETSVLKSLNKNLKEDFENLEREKKEADKKSKEERRKLEEHYDREISEMEKTHAEDKRNIKLKVEERFQQQIRNEQTSVEITINELREEVMLLRQENSKIDSDFSEINEELRQQLNMEREEYRKKLEKEREELKARLENEFHQTRMTESSGHFELVQQLDRDLGIMKARYSELEGNVITIRQERDMLAKEKEEMQRKYMIMEFEIEKRKNTSRTETQNDEVVVEKFKDTIRKKDLEISSANFQRDQTEIAMSALRREKIELQDEIVNLKKKLSSFIVREEPNAERPNVDNTEILSLQEAVRRKDEEMQYLKRDKLEIDSRLASLQRKNEEMEDELSTLRRKKLDVEDEISHVKREKSESDNQISLLRREKMGLEEQIAAHKKKQAELEDSMSAFKREKMNMEHEIVIYKRTIDNLEEELTIMKHKLSNEQQSEANSARGLKSSMEFEQELGIHKKKQIELEDNLSAVKREKMNMEHEIVLLKRTIDNLEEELTIMKQKLSNEQQSEVNSARESKGSMEFEEEISMHKKKQAELEDDLSAFKREKMNMEHERVLLKRTIDNLEGELRIMKQKLTNQQHSEILPARQLRDNSSTQRTNFKSHSPRHGDNFFGTENGIIRHDMQLVCKDVDNDDIFNTSTRSIEHDFDELVRQNRELEGAVRRLEENKAELERDIVTLKEKNDSLTNTTSQTDDMEKKLVSLNEDYLDLENCILKLRREEGGLEGHVEDLKKSEQDLKKKINDLNIEEKRIRKDIERFQEEKERLQISIEDIEEQQEQGNAQQGNGRRITGISHVSIQRVRKHESKDHELAELRKERDSLKKEIAVLKKNLGGNSFQQNQKPKQSENSNIVLSISKEMNRIEKSEVATLKKDRLQLEKTVAGLQKRKEEIDAEITVMRETKKREENELGTLRREKMELDTSIKTLSSKKARLEAEQSIVRDEMNKDDTAIEKLRRVKCETERQVYDLQRKKSKMETELSLAENVLRKKDNSISDWHSDSLKIENDKKELIKQRTEIELEIKRLQLVKSREEHELNVLRKQMEHLQSQISESAKLAEQVNNLSVNNDKRNIVENTQLDGAHSSSREYPSSFLYSSKPRIRTSIEIPQFGTKSPEGKTRSFDANEANLIPLDENDEKVSEINPNTRDKRRPSNYNMSDTEKGITRGYHVTFSANGNVTTFSGPNEIPNDHLQSGSWVSNQRERDDVPGNKQRYPGDNYGKTDGVINSVNNYDNTTKSEDIIGSQHGRVIQKGCQYCSSFSSSFRYDKAKENNDVTFLRRERQELEFQISERRKQLSKLQTDINELEHIKTVRETFNVQIKDTDRYKENELKKEIVHAKYEERNDHLRQEYEKQIEELTIENTELKQKVGLLEWQVENSKQKMEIQEMSFRRELSAVKEKLSLSSETTCTHKFEVQSDSSKLKEFYQHLSYVLDRNISNEEMIREIKTSIRELQHHKAVNVGNENSSPNISTRQRPYSYNENMSSKNTDVNKDEAKSAREYASQLKIQLEITDTQLKTCEKIIHRLYADNTDLNKLVLKLESKLKSASRSTEKMKRKRALLQKLVEKLSGHVGKEQLRQAYLVLELDKDIAI